MVFGVQINFFTIGEIASSCFTFQNVLVAIKMFDIETGTGIEIICN